MLYTVEESPKVPGKFTFSKIKLLKKILMLCPAYVLIFIIKLKITIKYLFKKKII